MKKFLEAVFFAKDAKTTLIIALALLGLVVLGCSGGGGSSKSKPVTSDYYGGWTGSDGTSLQIKSDGTGYYRSGGTTITGAAAELDETGKVLKLTFLGVTAKEFKIDEPPKNGAMKLDGMLYKNGFTGSNDDTSGKTSDDDNSSRNASAELPSQSEIDATVNSTLKDFTEAVEKGDFADFRDSDCSKDFKSSVSTERFNTLFDTFIKQKKDLAPILNSTAGMTPDYSPAPNMSDEKGVKLLNLKGSYATRQKTSFELQYISEDNDWKIYAIRIRVEPK